MARQTNKKKTTRRPWWHNIRFKYKLTIVNENTLEEVASLYVSKLNGLSVLLSILTLVFIVAALIIVFTPLRNYLPGYMNSEIRGQIVENALRLDSLQNLLDRQNLYIMNIQDIFRGNVSTDSIQSIDSLTQLRQDTLMAHTQREEAFRQQFENNEKYNLSNLQQRSQADGLIFYRPTLGMVSRPFEPEQQHYGTDIAAAPGESVLATLDGTVLLSTYTAEAGYVIQIQHGQDFVSIYKHCGSLLKKEGDEVKSGEAIAVIGQRKPDDTGPHLHFELWHRGRPMNPELFIVF